MGMPVFLIIVDWNKFTNQSGVKPMLFLNVCFVFSDLLLKRSEEDGFYYLTYKV